MKMKDEKFFKTLKDFLEIYLIRQRHYSKNTQKSYREAIRLLLQYFNDELGLSYAQMSFEDLTYSNVCGFLDWLEHNRGCSLQTVNLRLMAIRSFARYASIIDPARIYFQVELSNVKTKKSASKVVEFLSEAALKTLFEQPDISKKNGARDLVFMLLMYDVAARCQELLDLKLGDIEIRNEKSTVYLAGKGSKARRLPVSKKVVDHLVNYLKEFHPADTRRSEDFLFYTKIHENRQKMSSDAVSLFMKNYGERGRAISPEMPEKVHPHQLRHSRAMHLYRSGMPLVLLSEFLGHANINTTRIYAWADTEMKRKAIQKISPESEKAVGVVPMWQNDEQMIKKLYGII